MKKQDNSEKSHRNNRKKKIIIIVCFIAVTILMCKGVSILKERNRIRQEKEREWTIAVTLKELGDRAYGSNDINTVQYSMLMTFLSEGVLGVSKFTNLINEDADVVKEKSFETSKIYFKDDYLKSYAALIFMADYLKKEDVEYFYNGTKVNAFELKECMEELLLKNMISLSYLLVNSDDERNCYTISLLIRLAEDGFVPRQNMVSELYEYVYNGLGINTISEDLLADGITYEQVAENYFDSFYGEEIYFNNLTPVGKIVFLYLMPHYIIQYDQIAGSELWYLFEPLYADLLNEIMQRDIFSDVITGF